MPRRGEIKISRISALLLAMLLLIGVAGCSDTGIGAGVGAGGGALVGSAVGHPWMAHWLGEQAVQLRDMRLAKVITTTTDRGASHRAMATPLLSSMSQTLACAVVSLFTIGTGSSNSPRSAKESTPSAVLRVQFESCRTG